MFGIPSDSSRFCNRQDCVPRCKSPPPTPAWSPFLQCSNIKTSAALSLPNLLWPSERKPEKGTLKVLMLMQLPSRQAGLLLLLLDRSPAHPTPNINYLHISDTDRRGLCFKMRVKWCGKVSEGETIHPFPACSSASLQMQGSGLFCFLHVKAKQHGSAWDFLREGSSLPRAAYSLKTDTKETTGKVRAHHEKSPAGSGQPSLVSHGGPPAAPGAPTGQREKTPAAALQLVFRSRLPLILQRHTKRPLVLHDFAHPLFKPFHLMATTTCSGNEFHRLTICEEAPISPACISH